MMRTFVCGDIHGNHRGLLQCLERSKFNKEEDTLISLGDIADGWSETSECVDELLSIKNLISIVGNHDDWCRNWFNFGEQLPIWTQQGGQATVESYIRTGKVMDKSHKDFWNNQINYHIDNENRLFVHAGLNRHFSINDKIHNSNQVLNWDRDFWLAALSFKGLDGYKFKIYDDFKEVFIGHTATVNWNKTEPMQAANIWNLDTGAGFKGKLTIMNVETKEYFQSDLVNELYPYEKGR